MRVAFTLFIGDNVFTSNGKNIGKISKIDNEHFTVYNRGLIQDEEFQIPISAISHFDIKAGKEDSSIILTVNEEQIKHGYEIVSKKPNSELISGKSNSEYKIPLEKEVIHYETIQHFEENVASSTDKLPFKEEYICDMCMEKFNNPDNLQQHRAEKHSAPTGI
jgi:sporulation protein YlmC with PRC-barrel domain